VATFDIGVLEAWEGAGRTWPHSTVGPDAPKARQFLHAVRFASYVVAHARDHTIKEWNKNSQKYI
jgi:hypothetical protein